MVIPRREFLRLVGLVAGAGGLGGCGRFWSIPDRLVELALRGPGLETWTQTVCGLCEGTCGLSVRLVDGIPVGLKGNPQHPLNRGGLCPVGQSGLDVLYAPDRITGPLQRIGEGGLRPITWEEALATLAQRLETIRSAGEASKIAFLYGEPGQIEGDLIRYFMGALGSPNHAPPMDPSALAYRLTQGLDRPPAFDLGGTDLVVSFGQDLFEDGPAPLHAISTLVGSRLDGEKAESVHVGTRLSPSASKARVYVPVLPGTHGAFALGVAQVLVREGMWDSEFVVGHTFGFDDFVDGQGARRSGFRRLLVERYYPDRVARICGCEPSAIVDVARRVGGARSPIALIGGEGVAESNATWNVMAVHALNALTGAFNRTGGVVIPPQIPFAPMPALPNSGNPGPAPSMFDGDSQIRIGSRDPIEALIDGVLENPGSVEVLFVSCWNPVFESPAGGRLREALSLIPTVVVFSSFLDETAELADFVLPTSVFLESWQCATTPPSVPYGTVGIGSPVLDPLFDTRAVGNVVLDLGRRMDSLAPEFPSWSGYEDYVRYRLQGLVMAGQGSVVKGPLEEEWARFLEDRGWRFMEHTELATLWMDMVNHGGWWDPTIPEVAWSQVFPTPSGRFEFWSLLLEQGLRDVGSRESGGSAGTDQALERGIAAFGISVDEREACFPHHEAPLTVGDGEVRLMTFRPITSRGMLGVSSAMLLEMFGHTVLSGWETWVEISPETARGLGLGDGDIVEIQSERGRAELPVRVVPGGMPGLVHVPLGLGHAARVGPSKGVGANPVEFLPPIRDPLSGSLSLNGASLQPRLARRRPHGGPAPSNLGHSP